MRAIRPVSTVLFVISITVLLMMGCHGGRTDNPLIELATHTVAAEEPSSTTFASTPVPSTTSSESASASISQPPKSPTAWTVRAGKPPLSSTNIGIQPYGRRHPV